MWTGRAEGEPSQFAIADQDGQFEIRGIAPAAYRATAAPSIRARHSLRNGEPLSPADDERPTITLRVNAIQYDSC